jgi:hypothetical protein
MPLKRCSNKGASGWKWGDQGHCYTGPGAKKKAIKQGVAVEGPEKFAQTASKDGITKDELAEAIAEEGFTVTQICTVMSIYNGLQKI